MRIKPDQRQDCCETKQVATTDRWTVLINELSQLRGEMLALAHDFQDRVDQLPGDNRASAQNLLHYVALRRHDLRTLQVKLAREGLSSLGRIEPHALSGLEAVIELLGCLAGSPPLEPAPTAEAPDLDQSAHLLSLHAERLFGSPPDNHLVRIMVTMPSEAAHDDRLVRELVAAGMDCMRINCAHDDADAWQRMIDHLHSAREQLGRPCRVLMDLAGPKLRTGPLEPGPQVLKWRPHRDSLGHVMQPARIWMSASGRVPPCDASADAVLPISGDWVSNLQIGDRVKFEDARGRLRELKVVELGEGGCWAQTRQTAYVVPGTALRIDPHSRGALHSTITGEGRVGALPALEQPLILRRGDTLLLTGPECAGRAATMDEQGQILRPASIGCEPKEILKDLQAGQRVLFDDGKIGGVIRSVSPHEVAVEITQARPKGEKLRADKGINLPDSELQLPSLTEKDRRDLEFVVGHADLVGYSFVRSASDVRELQQHLARRGGKQLGIVLKIETRRAFDRLPDLLLAGLASPALGVMIARGDLAVECGYERLAELQEEILWICEAAHVPVIWATQVLESLSKGGLPSRAEITDAAMGERAECVMLNKGHYVVDSVKLLSDILGRMQDHQLKKRSMLRRLSMADGLSAV